MVVHKLKCIFIHIPKCGGTSIKLALNPYYNEVKETKHIAAFNLKKSNIWWDKYFKFAFVRNTWDRFVSYYFYCKANNIANAQNEEFDFWLRSMFEGEKLARRSQLYWLQCEGKIELDFIGKFENFQSDFKYVCNQLKTTFVLPKENVSTHAHYSAYYSDELAELVAKVCADEIEQFKFKFEPKSKKVL